MTIHSTEQATRRIVEALELLAAASTPASDLRAGDVIVRHAWENAAGPRVVVETVHRVEPTYWPTAPYRRGELTISTDQDVYSVAPAHRFYTAGRVAVAAAEVA